MSEKDKKFHEIALQTSLFKGQPDWYFCFLKSERIAHVLAVLAQHAPEAATDDFYMLQERGAELPISVLALAAGEISTKGVLADVFALLSSIRLLATRNLISKQTATILLQEYELLVAKFDAAIRVSPFVTPEDLAISLPPEEPQSISMQLPAYTSYAPKGLKDINKGHSEPKQMSNKPNERREAILSFIRSKTSVSIKDICRAPNPILHNCSEKTIQRELVELIQKGLIKKTGERRWSQYSSV